MTLDLGFLAGNTLLRPQTYLFVKPMPDELGCYQLTSGAN